MTFKVGQTVKVNKRIIRSVRTDNILDGLKSEYTFDLYAEEGETGFITELFRPHPTGGGEVKPISAKVNINGQIKTFRLTSLDQVKL